MKLVYLDSRWWCWLKVFRFCVLILWYCFLVYFQVRFWLFQLTSLQVVGKVGTWLSCFDYTVAPWVPPFHPWFCWLREIGSRRLAYNFWARLFRPWWTSEIEEIKLKIGEEFHFFSYFWDGLKPPTAKKAFVLSLFGVIDVKVEAPTCLGKSKGTTLPKTYIFVGQICMYITNALRFNLYHHC